MRRYHGKVFSMALRVNPETEGAVYRQLMRQPNRSGYIKRLIARDAARSQNVQQRNEPMVNP
jgi:hypothetical protein